MDWARVKECVEQYKKDTSEVAGFLKKAAGHTYRQKLTAPGYDRNGCEYVLNLEDFTPIAKHLAKQDSFSVPAHILTALERCIKLRTKCNNIYESQSDRGAEAKKKDETHKHFIEVIQDVETILLPKSASSPAHEPAEKQAMSDMKEPVASRGLGGMFGVVVNLPLLSKRLKSMRQAFKRCWSRRKAAANDDAVI